MSVNKEQDNVVHPVTGLPAASGADAGYQGRWAVVLESGEIPPSDTSRLSAVQLECRMGFLVLRAPGMLRLDVPLDVIEDDPSVIEERLVQGQLRRVIDEGEWAAAWLTQLAGRPARLVKIVSAEG